MPDVLRDAPSMLSLDERRLLLDLARHAGTGRGAIIDGGAFLGGSTLALGLGLRARRQPHSMRIHSYDIFILDEYMAQNYFPDHNPPPSPGSSSRRYYDAVIAPVADLVTVHEGDLRKEQWDGTGIDILFLDILKAWDTNDYVLRTFFPALLPGSVVVQQDYDHSHWWVPMTMELLSDYFVLTEYVEGASAVYLLRAPVPEDVLARGLEQLPVSDKLELMDRAVARWQGYMKGVMECARAGLRAWLLGADEAQEALQRIRHDYFWSEHVLTRADWVSNTLSGTGVIGPGGITRQPRTTTSANGPTE